MAQTAEGNALTKDERDRMCRNKRQHRREGEALDVAAKGMRQDGRQRRVYRCPVCRYYHVTTQARLAA